MNGAKPLKGKIVESNTPNRIKQESIARGEYDNVSPSQGEVVTVPFWVKLTLAGAIPMVGGIATMVPPPWNLVAGIVGLGIAGVASFLGMSVGAPKR